MATNSGSSNLTCFLCEDTTDEDHVTVYRGEVISLCHECMESYKAYRHELELRARDWFDHKLREWIKETKSVKRVYKKQMQLPTIEGGEI